MATAPYTVLTVVEAESGSWNYEIRISHVTGVTYCTCKGWQFRKTCKHLDAYNQAPSLDVAAIVAKSKGQTVPTQKLKPVPSVAPLKTDRVLDGSAEQLLTTSLGKLGFVLMPTDARNITSALRAHFAAHVSKLTAVASVDAPHVDTLNVANVRVIRLPG